MSGFRDKGCGNRLSTAQNARKAMLERIRPEPGADDPAVAERRAARQAISTAREVRLAEREAAKIAEQAHEATEREARQTADNEQCLVQEAIETVERAESAERQIALEAEQKAARDAAPQGAQVSSSRASAKHLTACHRTTITLDWP